MLTVYTGRRYIKPTFPKCPQGEVKGYAHTRALMAAEILLPICQARCKLFEF